MTVDQDGHQQGYNFSRETCGSSGRGYINERSGKEFMSFSDIQEDSFSDISRHDQEVSSRLAHATNVYAQKSSRHVDTPWKLSTAYQATSRGDISFGWLMQNLAP